MSGHSDSGPCPNCGGDCGVYTDWKPFSYTSMQCVHCGFLLTPVVSYLDLNDLNEYRKEQDLEPLDELPEQTFDW